MYWIWRSRRRDEEDASIHGVPQSIKELGTRFDQGLRYTDPIPPIELHMDARSQGQLTDNLIAPATTGLAFSSALRAALNSSGVDNIDYYPLKLINDITGEIFDDYQIANVIGVLECIDFSESDLELTDDGSIRFIESLVLMESLPSDLRMFRIMEYLPLVVVHERVKEAVEDNAMTGVEFLRPEDLVL